MLGDYLLDLEPYILEREIAAHFKTLIDNDTVNGRLVALPYNLAGGLLFYRKDLLRNYGYTSPPQLARIQAGERAKGDERFWGFVWQGGASEALSCNALEWQAFEGGGTIISGSGVIDVNNPRAIRAWERAARWVGSISPPGVTAYTEFDAFNVWESGHVAFMRNWPTAYIVTQLRDSASRDRFGVTAVPAGSAGHPQPWAECPMACRDIHCIPGRRLPWCAIYAAGVRNCAVAELVRIRPLLRISTTIRI
ncbi:MAG TPA: extracellular solute-binding protein [Bryobacteraceae bacterium]|nr:extracellular solute-binding protein [Bryobacteraceae bacterium]